MAEESKNKEELREENPELKVKDNPPKEKKRVEGETKPQGPKACLVINAGVIKPAF